MEIKSFPTLSERFIRQAIPNMICSSEMVLVGKIVQSVSLDKQNSAILPEPRAAASDAVFHPRVPWSSS